jgi:hypothetical protein
MRRTRPKDQIGQTGVVGVKWLSTAGLLSEGKPTAGSHQIRT